MTHPAEDDGDDFSEIAGQQFDEIMAGDDLELADAVWKTVKLIFDYPEKAETLSGTIVSKEGTRRTLPVGDDFRHKVFWDSTTGRVEGIFPWP